MEFIHKTDTEVDDPKQLAFDLAQAYKENKSLKEIRTILKRIYVCMAHKPIQWLEEFNGSGGINIIQLILQDMKKWSNNNYNSKNFFSQNGENGTLLGGNSHQKDIKIAQDIRFECMKIFRSFANTEVMKLAKIFKRSYLFSLFCSTVYELYLIIK